MGGLSKKAHKIDEIADFHQLPMLNIDAGGLLFKGETLLPAMLQQSRITAEGIIDAYNIMDVDAVGVSKRDLAGGLTFLLEQSKRSKFEWLSANLAKKSDQSPLFKKSIIKEIGPHKIGIIGLTGIEPPFSFEKNDDAIILPWQEVLPGLVAGLTAKCDLLILLSDHNYAVNQEIASTFTDIHMIIQAKPTSRNFQPNLVNNTLIFQTGKQGKYFGWMLIDWQDSHTWGAGALRTRISIKKQELDGLNGRIRRYEKKSSEEELKSHKGYQRLLGKRDNLIFIISGMETERDKLDMEGLSPSTFENTFVALEMSLPDNPAVLKIVEATKLKVNEVGRAKAKSSRQKASTTSYTGWRTCAECHIDQAAFWQKTDHAKAYQTLVDAGQQYNLNCLPCHVTGSADSLSSDTNGQKILGLPNEFQQVGCEECHGRGKDHAANPLPANILRKPPESTCRKCHTPARDNDFSYEDKMMQIACPPNPK